MAGTAGDMQQLASHPVHLLLARSGLPQLEEKLAPGLHRADFETLHITPLVLLTLSADSPQSRAVPMPCTKEARKTRAIWSSSSSPGINLWGKVMSFCL